MAPVTHLGGINASTAQLENNLKTELKLGRDQNETRKSADLLNKGELAVFEPFGPRESGAQYFYIGIGDGKHIRFVDNGSESPIIQNNNGSGANVRILKPGESFTITVTA